MKSAVGLPHGSSRMRSPPRDEMIPERLVSRAGAPTAGARLAFLALVLLVGSPLLVLAGSWPVSPGAQESGSVGQIEDSELAANPMYAWLRDNRAAAYWVAPLLMVVVAILPIPAEIPAAMNGMLFGTVLGVLMTWTGAVIGAQISYELSRCFGQKLARRFVKAESLQSLGGLKLAEAPVLLTLRLMPMVAFTVVNWASGFLQVRRSTFLWTTAIGILPGVIAFTAAGSFLASLYKMQPAYVTVALVLICAAFIGRAWWKHLQTDSRRQR